MAELLYGGQAGRTVEHILVTGLTGKERALCGQLGVSEVMGALTPEDITGDGEPVLCRRCVRRWHRVDGSAK